MTFVTASIVPLFALYAMGCGSSNDTHANSGGASASSASSSTAASSSSSPASSSSGVGGGGTGGGGVGGGGTGGSSFMPAMHPPAPQVVNLGGPVLKNPKVIAITYNSDVNQADIDKCTNEIAASTFWPTVTSEYGVGPLTVAPPIHIATPAPASISETTVLNNLKANLTGANPLWGPPDPTAIYTFVFPEGTAVTGGGAACCTDYDGYHDEITIGGKNLAYAIVCTCKGFDGPNFTALQDMTVALSHELVEAATDPLVESNLAWAQTADADAAWDLITEGELMDMCEFDGDQYVQPQDMHYLVQRSWSNKQAAAGKDPCLPLLNPPDVYFNSAVVVSDDVPVPFYGSTLMGKGIKIPVGQSRTVDLDLFSEAPTAGPWKIAVYDYNKAFGGKAKLSFMLDQDTGMNGDVRKLTITVIAGDPVLNAEPFWIESTLGNASNLWMGMVGQ